MNKWRIEIAELSSSSVLNSISVEASNWVSALRKGRKSIGDTAEVPQNASCTILPSGKVTIVDPVSRRKFTLTKENEIVGQKIISVAPPPSPEPERKSQSPRAAVTPTQKSQSPKAKSVPAREIQSPTVASDSSASKDSAKPERTEAANEQRPPGARISVIESLRKAGFPGKKQDKEQKRESTPTKPNATAEKADSASQKPQKGKPIMQKTVSYVLDPEMKKQLKSVAVGNKTVEASKGSRPSSNTGSEPQRIDAMEMRENRGERPSEAVPLASTPKQETQVASVSTEETLKDAENQDEAHATEKKPSTLSTYGFELLLERNEEPNDENPLTYRERCYAVPEGISLADVETAMREQIAILQDELREAPKGKFVNLAAFDHRWSTHPERPPVAIMQWKDWRGEAQIEFPKKDKPKTSQAPVAADRNSTLENAFEALHELQFLNTAAEGLDFVIKLLQEAIPAEASSACLYDINTHEMRFVVVSGPGAEQRKGEAVPLIGGLFGQAAKNYDSPTVVADVSANPHFDPEIDSRPNLIANNVIYRPLALDEQLLGMLQLINRTGRPQFSEQDVNLIDYIADQLSQFIHSSRMKQEGKKE